MTRRILLRLLIVLVVLLAVDRMVLRTVLADDVFLGRPVAPFDPPLFSPGQRARIERLRSSAEDEEFARRSILDGDLGWAPQPDSQDGEIGFDWAGARLGVGGRALPRERRPGVRRVVAVGCSFTLGAEVADDEAWPALVDDEREDLEIANLAMGAYGLDQALLRFRRDGRSLEPDHVWLGILPAALLRVTTHFPPLMSHWSTVVAFKPRFELGPQGELVLRPSPAGTHAETLRLLADQEAFLAAMGESDPWIALAPDAYAPRGSSWKHHFAIGRLATTLAEAGGHHPADRLADSDGELQRLLVALVLELQREARALGAELSIAVLPSREDLEWVAERGRGYWQGLLDELASRGLPCLDLTQEMLEARAHERPEFWAPDQHYAALGNRLVADAILDAWLR